MTDFSALARTYGTPLYVYDFDTISTQFTTLKEAFKARKSLICFAVKANSNLSVLKHMASLGAGCDCVSIGEVKRALFAGIPKYKIIFSGVGKRDDEIEEALKNDILMLNLESEEEMKRVEMIATKLGLIARISIRVNPNIDAQTHPYISTGLHENKFGVDIESAKRMYIHAKNATALDPVGIHFHIGSQITELQPFKEAAVVLANLLRNLKALQIDIKFFDVGGGIGIRYDDETTISLYEYAQGIFAALGGLDVTFVCEPGRYLVGNSGYFLTKVLYEKHNGYKRFVIVDGAMNDLIRPSLYGAYHEIEVYNKDKSSATPCDVVGPVCESGDFFAKETLLPPLEHDDLLVIKSAGAYGFTMSSNYNSRTRVAEVALEKGQDRLIRARERFEDLIALEKEYL
ncbi:MAG: diaminopimelate decarboxylase [Sulfurospirillum sp.]|jgi:diaminopimelate decarboxylase|nr:diaminopimelate decarboxylase [Sulfurospirillum sp.]MBP9491680.1 diaminopimelate decarboxylase [Sulfurospirillum sp.]MBP9612037.1 diaminopimelate decarboxylase [Sulfurospirillum sp.]